VPNLREQRVGPLGDKAPSNLPGDQVGLYLKASDGREVVITRRQVRQQFQSETGTVAQRKLATRQWVRQTIVAALGVSQIAAADIDHDFDEADGTPTGLTVGG
jgi:hypothetical protein